MKTTIFFLLICLATTGCYTPKKTESNIRVTERFRSLKPAATKSDTVIIDDTISIPLIGRSENGVRQELSGTWVLQTLNGIVLSDNDPLTIEALKNKKAVGNRSDTVSSFRMEGGKAVATTEITTIKPAEGAPSITQTQGTKYHIPVRPYLSFYGSNETFSGFTGCNKIAGRYSVSSRQVISFKKAAPSTQMVCIGDYNEATFVEALQSVNAFKNEGGQLAFLQGTKVVMVFARKS